MLFCNILRGAVFTASAAALAAIGPSGECAERPAGPRLESLCRPYSLKLSALFNPQAGPMGLLVRARIGGGPSLRLLLDSGAQHIVLNKWAAGPLSAAGSTLELIGLGGSDKGARRLACATVEISDLALRDCDMLSVGAQLLDGIDGVIPMSLFAGFLVRLDIPKKTLYLDPYTTGAPIKDEADSPARTDNSLLFLEATLNESQSGYILLDTGASYNAVSSDAAARGWKGYRTLSPTLALRGFLAEMGGSLLPHGVRFRFGSRVVSADPAVVVDLSGLSRRHPFAIAGILGYPALQRSIVTINYRDEVVRINAK
jgi:hypothetical protein